MNISLDVDGTLADVIPCWLKRYGEKMGRTISEVDVDEWSFWKKLDVSREEFFQIFSEVWYDWRHIPPTEPDLGGKVKMLNTLGEVDIVTARTKDTLEHVKKWLAFHNIVYNRFVAVPSRTYKASLLYDVYIDDSPDLAVEVSKTKRTLMLFDRPWNRKVREDTFVKRLSCFDEIVEAVRNMRT